MLTGENKAKIDRIWDAFWSGGISDPLRVIEQISYLLFIKRLDDLHTAKEKKANRLGKPVQGGAWRDAACYFSIEAINKITSSVPSASPVIRLVV